MSSYPASPKLTMLPGRKRRPAIWVYGACEISASLVFDWNDVDRMPASRLAVYADDPRHLPEGLLANPRLAALLSPTPSPFSHDANLVRMLAREFGIVGVCGVNPAAAGVANGATVRIVPGEKVILGTIELPVNTGVAGSDESLSILVNRAAVCYRPRNLYQPWMGKFIATGLDEGVAALVSSDSARAVLEDTGRVWLLDGPFPNELADWILSHGPVHAHMLLELAEAFVALTSTSWSQTGMLTDPDYLKLLRVSCRVSPFVGFALFSLTAKCAALGADGMRDLEAKVADTADLVSRTDREERRLSDASAGRVQAYVRALAERVGAASEFDLVAATVLLSDVRRLVNDELRRKYPIFDGQVRHRERRAA